MPITVAARRNAGLASPLRAIVRAALALESRRAGEIEILLTDDAQLRALNLCYRRLDRTTDVLSFGDPEAGVPGSPVSGDIAISLDRVQEQAKRFRVTRGEELARLVIHGTLHLAGLDHDATPQRRRMRAREVEALRAVKKPIRDLERALERLATSG